MSIISQASSTLKNTAEVVSFFDALFDSVNGRGFSKTSKEKSLRQAVTNNSQHHEFWREAIQKLNVIKFVEKHGKETSVPLLKNWITRLKSYQTVWQYFFGQVRAYNFRNTNPDCHTFKSLTLILTIVKRIQVNNY